MLYFSCLSPPISFHINEKKKLINNNNILCVAIKIYTHLPPTCCTAFSRKTDRSRAHMPRVIRYC